jgi:hypothetical protein
MSIEGVHQHLGKKPLGDSPGAHDELAYNQGRVVYHTLARDVTNAHVVQSYFIYSAFGCDRSLKYEYQDWFI